MNRPGVTARLAAGALATALGVGLLASAPQASAADPCPKPGGARVAVARVPDGDVKVYGHGWGHGMGMSQYGAQGAAKLGCDYRTILATYYRDTDLVDRRMTAPVSLRLATTSARATLQAETGPVRWLVGDRAVVQPRAATWSVQPGTQRGVRGLSVLDAQGRAQAFAVDGALVRAQTGGSVVRVKATGRGSGLRTTWGTTRFTGAGGRMAVSHVISSGRVYPAVQKYLFGLAEVPASWPVEALKAQVVAARTYLASKYSASERAFVLGTGTSDQVYRGYDQEAADARVGGHWKEAVIGTARKVLVDGDGDVISAMYSSSMGGHTENRKYVYGSYGISYLRAVDDSRWDNASDNPYRTWSRGYSMEDFAARLGFTSVTSFSLASRGSAQRLDGLVVTGERAGEVVTEHFTGSQARSRLGLRSPGFVFGVSPSQ